MADAPAVTVDGSIFDARPGELLIAAAERNGVYIPRFCWHPRMKPVGMCRMCLVEVEGPRGKALQPACMLAVSDGMVVDTQSDVVKKAQDGVLEFLLINHPLDCPVCDRGGECPLQDQTLVYGPGESRFVEEKRHFEKPIPISELVLLDRERCIQCARCTRFAEEVAGDPLINFVQRGNEMQVLTFPDDPFTSYFSGNTVQICPVGALLAAPYRFRARPWDLEQVESTCTSCAVGCRIAVQSSTDRLTRYLGIDSEPVNHGWLCDKGRFDYEAINSEERLTHPMVRKAGPGGRPEGADGELVEASWGEALVAAADGLRQVRDTHGPGALALLGGARVTNEDAYAWAKLAKAVLRTDNVDCQLDDGLPAEAALGLPRATIDEACSAGAVVLLAPDLKEELPVLYLRLREAAVEDGVPVVELTPKATGITRHAAVSLSYRPGQASDVARALVSAVSGQEPRDAGGVPAAALAAAAQRLRDSNPVVVLGRPSLADSAASVVEAAGVLADGLRGCRFLSALRRANVHGALDMGLAPGILPGRVSLDDGRDWFSSPWGALPDQRGLDAAGILSAAADGRMQGLVLLGADPLADFPDRTLARQALAAVGFVVAVDLFMTDSVRQADVVLPAAGFAEKPGTTTNVEGRVSRLAQKVTPPGTSRADWMIAAELATALGADLGFDSVDAIWTEIERVAPAHAGLTAAVLAQPGFRDGIVVPLPDDLAPTSATGQYLDTAVEVSAAAAHASVVQDRSGGAGPEPHPDAERVPASTELDAKAEAAEEVAQPDAAHDRSEYESGPTAEAAADEAAAVESEGGAGEQARPPSEESGPRRPSLVSFRVEGRAAPSTPLDSYSLRLVSSRRLYDAGTFVSRSPSLAGLAPGPGLRANPYDLDRLGVSTGAHVRVTSPRTSLVMTVTADTGVPRGSAVIPFNLPGQGAADLIDRRSAVTDVRLETLDG